MDGTVHVPFFTPLIKPTIMGDSKATHLSITKGNAPSVYKVLFNELLKLTRRNCTVSALKHQNRFLSKWCEIATIASKMTRGMSGSAGVNPKMMGQAMLTGRLIIELYVKHAINLLGNGASQEQESYRI